MASTRPPAGHRIATLLAILPVWSAPAPAAEFRNFQLPCLAPLLKKVDSEAPTSINVAFLRGPWRRPQLRSDLGTVDFPITSKSEEVAAWFNQGVALLHGQANAEAERSFRQALLLDPENPMIFWGLSMANEQRPGRARLFAQNAVRRVGNATTARERLWIDVLGHFHALQRNGPAKLPPARALTPQEVQAQHRQRIRDLEAIALAHPDDLEAKAFLLRQLTLDLHRLGSPLTSYLAVDRLAQELATLAPRHPSAHYRIFLWLHERPEQTLTPARTSAHQASGLADSWRFAAEAWRANGKLQHAIPFLETALRIHHREMRDHLLMPHEVENLAANYGALIDAFGRAGKIEQALTWCQRLLSLPRRPGGGSSQAQTEFILPGRRLFAQTLLRAEFPQRLLNELAGNPLLQADPASRRERAQALYWRGLALATLGKFEKLAVVEEQLLSIERSPSPDLDYWSEIRDYLRGLKSYRSLCALQNPDQFAPPHLPKPPRSRLAECRTPGSRLALHRSRACRQPGSSPLNCLLL